MEEKFHAHLVGGFPNNQTEYSSSITATTENLEEISEKIAKMVPDMTAIKSSGIIKQTESFKQSKQILNNFKTTMNHLPDGLFTPNKELSKVEEKDNRSPLEQATDNLNTVVTLMIKAGIKVPQIYKDFLYSVRPPIVSNDINIEKSSPLFSITGLDENGNVKIETDTNIEIRKGNKKIKLKEEKLIKTLKDGELVDTKNVKKMRDWISHKIKEAGSLEKIKDEDWNKLRDYIKEKCNDKMFCNDNSDTNLDTDNNIEKLFSLEKEAHEKVERENKLKERVYQESENKEILQTVNKNAYEIRLEVLREAIQLVKLKKGPTIAPTEEEILTIASKLYKFVENKR